MAGFEALNSFLLFFFFSFSLPASLSSPLCSDVYRIIMAGWMEGTIQPTAKMLQDSAGLSLTTMKYRRSQHHL